jgi:Fur family ferric uptake transcriptional regulator
MTDQATLVTALDRAGYRLTEPRRQVAELIASRQGHFTAADLVESAREQRLGIGRATIFRALDLFATLNVVEHVDLPDGGHAYVRCEPAHHHHVICTSCGRTAEVDDLGMGSVAREVARRSGYRVDTHRLELFGICPDCQGTARR